MSTWVEELVVKYYDFLIGKTDIVTQTGSDWAVISTPFVGMFNDTLEVYTKIVNGKISLSDDGVTLKNLELIGIPLNRSQKRKDIFDKILLTYGIILEDGELVTFADQTNFAQKKHKLVTAISEINDMYMLAKHTVASVFRGDVQDFLDEQEIIYTPQFISKGSTGLEFTFDFQLAFRDKEIVIKSFNSLNKLNLPNFLFTWGDIKSVREKITNKKITALAVINDENKSVSSDYTEALTSQNADYIFWTKRHTPDNIAKLKGAA